ncbi:MAG: leucine-rich repeat protein [Oscillospiraceae bacterium]|nr:leucine-rich repeat protein [Oscillospiraceae bacterium]
MKHGKLSTWLSAAMLGIGTAAFAALSGGNGIRAAAAQQSGETDTWGYTYDTDTNEATVTEYKGGKYIAAEIPETLGGCTVTGIGPNVFWQKYLTEITIPDTVKTIGNNAFGWNRMETVTVPAGVTTLPDSAFWYCRNLTSAVIKGAETVESDAFRGCTALTEVSLPKAKTVSDHAFAQCGALASVSLPKAETVADYAFYQCSALAEAAMPQIKGIGSMAFYGCTSLETVSLPASCTSVGTYAFYGCSGITGLTISGPAVLDYGAFRNCTSLAEVQLSDSSSTDRSREAFINCPITKVNGAEPLSYQTDGSGNVRPVLNSDIETAVRNHFARSINVKFVDDYCSAFCKYLVATETDEWMNKALKARQLHDWLVRHCQYEDCNGDETYMDSENHVPSSVFLSYALNVRGTGIGESVCEGYAKAYTMLLAEAGIESYRVNSPTHQWNLVNIGEEADEYYQVDVTWDDPIMMGGGDNVKDAYSTRYTHFLKSNADMESLHGAEHADPQPVDYDSSDHILLGIYSADIPEKLALCTASYEDANSDGILDNDYDLDGAAGDADYWEDTLARQMLCGQQVWHFGYDTDINGKLPVILSRLHQYHTSFWNLGVSSDPADQTVQLGSTAEFKVTVLSDNLTYQWQYFKTSTGEWADSTMEGCKTDTVRVPATEARNGQKYRCIVRNRNGDAFTSEAAVLTVMPQILAKPKNAGAAVGDTAKFQVSAKGTGLTYQWQYYNPSQSRWINSTMTGAKTANLSVPATVARNGQKYRCIIKNKFGNAVTTAGVLLKVTAKITAHPKSVTASVGETAKFSVTATGTGLVYQWQYYNTARGKWVNSTMQGAKTANLSVPVTAARNGQKYKCVIKNSLGNYVNSQTATLTVR